MIRNPIRRRRNLARDALAVLHSSRFVRDQPGQSSCTEMPIAEARSI